MILYIVLTYKDFKKYYVDGQDIDNINNIFYYLKYDQQS